MKKHPHMMTGVILIGVGAFILLQEHASRFSDGWPLLFIAAFFIIGYFSRDAYGLLIPGAILAGLALGRLLDDVVSRRLDTDSLGLGLGFLAIFFIDRTRNRQTHWWPLVPGLALTLSGLASGHTAFSRLFQHGWPLIFIAIGIYLLIQNKSHSSHTDID